MYYIKVRCWRWLFGNKTPIFLNEAGGDDAPEAALALGPPPHRGPRRDARPGSTSLPRMFVQVLPLILFIRRDLEEILAQVLGGPASGERGSKGRPYMYCNPRTLYH